MSSQDHRRRMIAIATAFGATIGAAALPAAASAADLDSAFFGAPAPQPAEPVEFGTGWYIRGDMLGAYQTQPELMPNYGSVPTVHNLNWGAEIGGGYQFNQWFRADATYTYYGEQEAHGYGASVNCPSSLDPLYPSPTSTTIIGVLVNQNQCTPKESASLQKNLFLANGYVDLGTWGGVTPYLGAGVGAAYMVANQAVNYYNNSDGSPYRATLTLPNPYPVPLIYYDPTTGLPLNPQPHYNTGTQNWDFSKTYRKWNFAFALMAGLSYNLTDHIIIDLGYRYVNFGSFAGISSLSGTLFSNQVSTQEIRLGLRYMID